MLAYREWRLRWSQEAGRDRGRPVLFSAWIEDWWGWAGKVADAVPGESDCRGLHGFADWAKEPLPVAHDGLEVRVVGAVDAHGLVRVHADGVVRAERARILALRVVAYPGEPHAGLGPYLNRAIREINYCYCAAPHDDTRPRLDIRELEEMLLETYRVPRLPDGVGPWLPPRELYANFVDWSVTFDQRRPGGRLADGAGPRSAGAES